jgi:hypothetical protein
MVRRITEDTLNKMIAMRKSGSTYLEISNTLGVSKERCLNYLKDVEQTQNETESIDRDTKIHDILKTFGFTGIINLKRVCSQPYRSPISYGATLKEEPWLISLLTPPYYKKSVQVSLTDGYISGILINDGDNWKLIKVTKTIIENVTRHFESTDVIS